MSTPCKPKGLIVLRSRGYYARYWTTVDGARVRVTRKLRTTDRAAAEAELRRLLAAASASVDSVEGNKQG